MCETDMFGQIMLSLSTWCVNIIEPTYIAVYIELDIAIVGPYDGIDGSQQEFKEEPEAEGCDTEIPALSHEARQ